MTATTNPFRQPSSAPAPGEDVKLNAFEGALCIFTYRGRKEQTTKYKNDDGSVKMKNVVIVDIDCVEGVPTGTTSLMPPREFGEKPKVLADLTGQEAKQAYVFAGWVAGAFRGMDEGQLVLGRLVVEGREYEGKNQPTWILKDATEAEIAKAVAYLNAKQAGSFATPSSSQSDQPDF